VLQRACDRVHLGRGRSPPQVYGGNGPHGDHRKVAALVLPAARYPPRPARQPFHLELNSKNYPNDVHRFRAPAESVSASSSLAASPNHTTSPLSFVSTDDRSARPPISRTMCHRFRALTESVSAFSGGASYNNRNAPPGMPSPSQHRARIQHARTDSSKTQNRWHIISFQAEVLATLNLMIRRA
jgi:hypothetical protein